MSDDTIPEEPVSSVEPIDADFEPADEIDERRQKPAVSGPGWLGAIVLSMIAAGLGGIIGVAGGSLTGRDTATLPGLNDRLETLEQQQGETDLQLVKVAQEQGQLENDIRGEMKTLVSGDGNGESLKALVAELDTVSQRLDEAMASGGNAEVLTALKQRIDALEAVDTTGEVSSQDVVRAIAGIEVRLDLLEQSVRTTMEAAAGADPHRLAQIEASIVSLRSEVQTATSSGTQDTEKLTSLLELMRQEEAEARDEAEMAAETAAIARALSAIEATSRTGGGFQSEYRTLRNLLPREDAVRQLAGVASSGAPTVAELQEDFATASAAARKALPSGGKSGLSWVNRIFGDAVSVRRIDGEDVDPAVILSRASDAMDKGDVRAAVELAGQLEGDVAQALSDWTEQANRRITLEEALESLQLHLIEGDNKTP